MKKIIYAFEGLPWIVQLILVIFWNIYGNVLRLFKSIEAKNVLGIALSIVLLCVGWIAFPVWIIDIVFVASGRKIWWFV